MTFVLLVLLLTFAFILMKSTEITVVSLRRLSRKTGTRIFTLSAIILALGTSFPELFVSLTSALEGVSSLPLGLVIGSNIANISLVAGLSALATGQVTVHGNFLRRDIFIALIAGILPVLLVLDRSLSRVDGLILLSVYGAYASSFFKSQFIKISRGHKKQSFFHRFLRQFNHIDSQKTREYGRLFIGIALMLFSADIIVRIAKALAVAIDVPVFLVGLIFLAVGTSLPELAFSFRSLRDRAPAMFFGNLLGSTIANSTLVIGLAAVLAPVRVLAVEEYLVSVIAFVVIFSLFVWFIRSKHRLDRWEAVLLLILYFIFVVIEFL